ncbi:MAG: hypothetical protein HY036_07690 [Nitrospirae bacterium]|nr:hypothetical protein [Nitrospirota bacterium]MBI3352446.1 hypothetical protein [Nitrospirota bacterium]
MSPKTNPQRRIFQRPGFLKLFGPFVLGLIYLTPVHAAPAIIDQILAVVDGQLITQSDLHFQMLFSLEFPLLEEKDKDPHLQFAIDQVLFLEEAEKFGVEKPTEKEINARLTDFQNGFGTEEKFQELLIKEGLTIEDVKKLIVRYLLSKEFVDQRINFFIFVSDNEIESFYKDHLSDWNGASLEEVHSQISTLLFEQKRKIKFEEFLVKRRAKATIRINPPYIP